MTHRDSLTVISIGVSSENLGDKDQSADEFLLREIIIASDKWEIVDPKVRYLHYNGPYIKNKWKELQLIVRLKVEE